MNAKTLLADPDAIRLDKIVAEPEALTLVATTARRSSECPHCGTLSSRVHSRYLRTVADLPCSGIAVRLRLCTRRFRCSNDSCTRSIFCERLPSVVAGYARRTVRLTAALELIGFALGGRPGARLARQLAMQANCHTLLRLIRRAEPPSRPEPPSVIGIDDWALRKGRTYGTILVDLERHRVLDLLPDRTAETSAAWLGSHPGIGIVSRDRATAYAEAITRALPEATQVADRFHLLKNVTEMLDRVLQRHGGKVREASKAMYDEWAAGLTAAPAPAEPPALTREQTMKQEHRARRLARYEEVIALHKQGVRQRAIARTLRLSRATVTKYIRAGEFPERRPERARPSMVDKFAAQLAERWAEGCRSSLQLWRELREQGYTGGHSGFWQYLQRWRPAEDAQPLRPQVTHHLPAGAPRPPQTTAIAPRAAAWLLQQSEADLRPDEQRFVAHLHESTPELAATTKIVTRFRQMIRERQVGHLDAWLAEAMESGITELRNFAHALRRDYSAVKAALEYGWSQGQVEGQINRLKNIKRQMFGRAKIDLLRARVLHT